MSLNQILGNCKLIQTHFIPVKDVSVSLTKNPADEKVSKENLCLLHVLR